jgi:hypothetical protein
MLRFWLKPNRFAALVAVLLLSLALASLWTYCGPRWKHHRAISRLNAAGTPVHGSRGDDWMTESKWEIARRWAPTIAHTAEVAGDSSKLEVGRTLQLLSDVRDLKHVRLTDVPLAKEDWEWLARLESVESIELRRLTVTKEGIANLSRLPALERLDLSAATVEDGVLLSLVNCRRLKRINVPASLAAHPDMENLLSERGDIDVVWVAQLRPEERANLEDWMRQGVRIEGDVSHGIGPRRWVVRITQPPTDVDALLEDLRPLGLIEHFAVATPAVSDELVTALSKASLGTERIGISGSILATETVQCFGECATLRWLSLRQVRVPKEALQKLRSQPNLFVELIE